MIIDITLQIGKSPTLPLGEISNYVGAPSFFFIRGVPQTVGSWRITSVQVSATHPDNVIASAVAVRTGAVWTATLAGSSTPGKVSKGFVITASGIDENGDAVTGYVLGIGDFNILNRDGTITPGATTYYAHLVDEIPQTPHKGDLANFDGVYKLYDGTTWVSLGADIAAQYAEEARLAKVAAETAQGKAEAAETGAVNAKSAAVAAKTAAESAKVDAVAAKGSAEAASAAAVLAKTAAETAQGKAEVAQTAAETAQGKAEAAETAAESAKVDAVAAKGSAEAASAAAVLAKTAAETAQGKAETAQTKAETAQGKAETAQTAAEAAQAAAEAAAASVNIGLSVVNGLINVTFDE